MSRKKVIQMSIWLARVASDERLKKESLQITSNLIGQVDEHTTFDV